MILRELDEEDLSSIQAVFEACEDYFIHTTGGPVTSASAHSLYIQLPAGKSYEDKHILGICDAETNDLVGVIDAILGYPEPDTAMLGLFLIKPKFRDRIGRKAYALLERWVKERGFVAIRVSVHEDIKDDANFWKSLGFGASDQVSQDENHTVLVYEKRLS